MIIVSALLQATIGAILLATSSMSFAETYVTAKINKILSFQTHTGLLVRMATGMADPENCGRSDWFIFPDNVARAQFVQSMLLTQLAKDSPITVEMSGCYEGMPRIVHVSIP